jgi:hypothetical protein
MLHNVSLYVDGGLREADLHGLASYLSQLRGVTARAAGDATSRLCGAANQAGVSPHPGKNEGIRSAEAAGPDAKADTDQGEEPAHRPQFDSIDDAAKAFASTRVHNLMHRDSFEDPLPAEVNFIARQLSRSSPRAFGHLYDAMAAMSVYRAMLPHEADPAIVFTYQIMTTWDEGDLKYHARVLVAGSPSIISIPGVVLAPARPREYYMYQASARAAGKTDEEIDERMRQTIGDRYVTHGDPRIPEILKGYALQAVFYWILGENFCDDPDCRLFNAHWQEEMLRAQLGGSYDLCPRHAGMLRGG